MNIDKATPGPWHARRLRDNDGAPYATQYQAHIDIGVCMVWAPLGNEEQEANARLIAAAPDLLVACQTFAEWLRREEAGGTNEPWAGRRDTPEGEAAWREWYCENLRICDLAQKQARAAIAKATGEAP